VLERSIALEAFALRCGQAAAMHCLRHFITVPTFRGRTPVVLLGFTDDNELSWAVLLYEITPFGLRTGIYSTDDISGFRTVIASAPIRNAAASAAANALLAQGAQVVMLSCLLQDQGAGIRPVLSPSCRWALRTRDVANTLLMRDTYEATLKSLGKATRFNMGYYRRRLAKRMGSEFIADARGMFSEAEIDALNAASLNPFIPGLARLQYTSACTERDGFLVGLRAEDGRWLGLVGGWRQAETTVLLWQMNRAGLERDSLGTVVRGYFLEHEISRSARQIIFYGGTPNSIQNSFVQDTVTDLIVVCNSWQSPLIAALAWFFGRPHRWKRSTNFLAATLADKSLHWYSAGSHTEQLK